MSRSPFLVALAGLVAAAASSGAASAVEKTPEQKMMEARLRLLEAFHHDPDAAVPVATLGLPPELAARFDADGDGLVRFAELERLVDELARRSDGVPADRSGFTHLREGGFPLNVDPEIVSADEAGLADEDIVLGVVVNGAPRAYPVNYMNGPTNEVVNDTLGGTPIAPSW